MTGPVMTGKADARLIVWLPVPMANWIVSVSGLLLAFRPDAVQPCIGSRDEGK